MDHKDPRPLSAREYLDVTISLRQGRLVVEGLKRGRFRKKRSIPRFRGRYELRLYSGRRLRDIVRFSFPLTLPAGERTRPNIELDRALSRGVRARTVVRVPFPAPISRIMLLDTKLGRRMNVDLKAVRPPSKIRPRLPGPKRTSVFR